MTLGQQAALTIKMALPAILAQLSTILMFYIDGAMVGRLGANESASVGLMNSSLWLFCREIKKNFPVALSGECADE